MVTRRCDPGSDDCRWPEPPLRVVIADDQALVRTGFRMILDRRRHRGRRRGGQRRRGGRRGPPHPARRGADGHPDARDGRPGGHPAHPDRRRATSPRVIILTTFDLDQYVYAALSAGASGFLLKDVTPEHLVAAVRLVRAGDALLAPAITRRLVERFAGRDSQTAALHRDLSALTPRELEVLRLLAQGLSNAELAAQLQLSPRRR